MSGTILDEARALQDQVVTWRRDFHQHPELGFEEVRTSAIVAQELERLGLKVSRNVARTGVLADLVVPGSKGCLLLRADMDALPVQESSDEPFVSVNRGVSHLCGHDSHVAMLLGAARLLVAHRGELRSSVRFMFQPSEEKGPGGAIEMIKEGCLEGVDRAFAIHVFASLEAGLWGLRIGPVMAAVDAIRIVIHGRGGHAATPEVCVDPVVGAAEAIMALHTIMSRRISPLEAGVLSLCTVHGGDAFNVIPETVEILGTLRSHSPAMRHRVKKAVEEILRGIELTAGVKTELEFQDSYPPTVNDAAFIEELRRHIGELFGPEQAVDIEKKFGGEDFSYVLEKVPGAMIFLGVGNARKGISAPHHNPSFRIDEEVLWQGPALLARVALAHHAGD